MSLYVIGSNYKGELGVKNEKCLNKLTLSNHQNIIDIKCGHKYNIYIDSNNNFFSCGSNINGQCGIGNFNETINELTEITYFKKNKIDIKNVCVSVTGSTTFWITNKGKLYANGLNENGQFGIGDIINRNIPTLVNNLEKVIHIESSKYYSIAICGGSFFNVDLNKFVKYYAFINNNNNDNKYNDDIINLIKVFFGNTNKVYSTAYSLYGANGHGKDNGDDYVDEEYSFNDYKWHQIGSLKNIIEISVGHNHSLFLDLNGTVWSCGYNIYNQLGLGKNINKVSIPQIIPFNGDIKIKHIASGPTYNVLIDYDDRIYSFGRNQFGQCGQQIKFCGRDIEYPTLINLYNDNNNYDKIKIIKCGTFHSYFCTVSNKHYLFGDNTDNECLQFEDIEQIDIPFLINKSIHDKFPNKSIKNVYCGSCNTVLILVDK